jgi:hypothetical protein
VSTTRDGRASTWAALGAHGGHPIIPTGTKEFLLFIFLVIYFLGFRVSIFVFQLIIFYEDHVAQTKQVVIHIKSYT